MMYVEENITQMMFNAKTRGQVCGPLSQRHFTCNPKKYIHLVLRQRNMTPIGR